MVAPGNVVLRDVRSFQATREDGVCRLVLQLAAGPERRWTVALQEIHP
jgi:hypothetical protein